MAELPYTIQKAKELKELAFANGFDMLDLQGAALTISAWFCLTASDHLAEQPLRLSERSEYSAMALQLDTIIKGIDEMAQDKGKVQP